MSEGFRLAAHGKLPLSREFLSFGCGDRHARGFSDFLHEAARHLAELEPAQRDAIRLYAAVPGGPVIAASIWPSADEGGARRFPFSLFLECVPDRVPVPQEAFCTAFAAVHGQHESAFAHLGRLEGPAEFERFLTEWAATAPAPLPPAESIGAFERKATTYPTGRWAAALYGTDARRFLVVLWRLRNLVTAAGRLPQDCAGVRVPLVTSHVLETQADAWLALLGRHGLLTAAPSVLLGRFGENGGASLAVFFRPLQPADLALAAHRPVRGLIDLAEHKEPADMDGFHAFAESMRTRLQETHVTLDRFPDILDGVEYGGGQA